MISMSLLEQSNLRIMHDRPGCIACGACASINPKGWRMSRDGKSDLLGAQDTPSGSQIKEISREEKEINMECAYSCPVNVIHIIENDEKLI
jgi:ferredoxin